MATADNKQGKSEGGARAFFQWERNWRTQTKDHIAGYVDSCRYYFDFFVITPWSFVFEGEFRLRVG